jgi:hypothetical protein
MCPDVDNTMQELRLEMSLMSDATGSQSLVLVMPILAPNFTVWEANSSSTVTSIAKWSLQSNSTFDVKPLVPLLVSMLMEATNTTIAETQVRGSSHSLM